MLFGEVQLHFDDITVLKSGGNILNILTFVPDEGEMPSFSVDKLHIPFAFGKSVKKSFRVFNVINLHIVHLRFFILINEAYLFCCLNYAIKFR